MNKIITSLISLLVFNCSILYAQENSIILKSVVVDDDKKPIEVFSAIIFQEKDTASQVVGNTFTNGALNLLFTTKEHQSYEVRLLSFGYKDRVIPVSQMQDTLIMQKNYFNLGVVEVSGLRKVTITMGENGGLNFDVENTNISNIGRATMLLKTLPGVDTDDFGNVSIIGKGDALIYINGKRQIDKTLLKSLKSEDIKSVEILRSPSAKYGAEAVVLIEVKRIEDGIRSNVGIAGSIGKGNNSIYPYADFSFKQKKFYIAASYSYYDSKNSEDVNSLREIKSDLFTDNWMFKDISEETINKKSHYGSVNVQYNINEHHSLGILYFLNAVKNENRNSTKQKVNVNDLAVNDNSINQNTNRKFFGNNIELYYKGAVSKKVKLEFTSFYSDKIDKNDFINKWSDVINVQDINFLQATKNNAYSFENQFIVEHSINKKNKITYVADYSRFQNTLTSDLSGDRSGYSEYEQTSNYFGIFGDYNLKIDKSLALSLGFNLQQRNTKDNNPSQNEIKNTRFVPYVSILFERQDIGLGVNGSFKIINELAPVRYLNEITSYYISPYELSKGNATIKNIHHYITDLSVNYQIFTLGATYKYINNYLMSTSFVEKQENGTPLIVNTFSNIDKPFHNISAYLSAGLSISIWSPTLTFQTSTVNTKIRQQNDVYEHINSTRYVIDFGNSINLKNGINIYASGSWQSAGYTSLTGNDLYNLNSYFKVFLHINKSFFNKSLTVGLTAQNIFYGKFKYQVFQNNIASEVNLNQYATKADIHISWNFNKFTKKKTTTSQYINNM